MIADTRTPTGSRVRVVVLLAILVTSLFVGFAALSATAADTSGMFHFEPGDLEADSGDTVEVDVMFRTGGGDENEGAGTIEFTLQYDSAVLTATDIEPGPFLEGDDGNERGGGDPTVNASTAIDDDNGSAWINQTRTIADGGVIGDESVATVTFEIADDVEPTDATLGLTDRTVVLVSDDPEKPDHLQPTMSREGTIAIDGGAGDGDDSGDPDGVTLADDAETGSDEGSSDEDDPIPEFGLVVTLTGLSVAVGVGTLLTYARRPDQ